MSAGGPALPPGAVDTHFHVFGPAAAFPYAAGRTYTPEDAPFADYLELASQLGISRSVIVQPSPYGTDNARTLSVMAEAPMPMRGVVVVDESVGDSELARMHDLGVRGVRLNLVFNQGLALGTARRLAPRLREMGWHIQLLVDVSTIDGLRAEIDALDVVTVFDHFGHVPAGRALGDSGFAELLDLVRAGRAWVKLSGAYRITAERAAPYSDVSPLARALIEANPNRVIWATDWPHPAIALPQPNDRVLAEMALGWAPNAQMRHKLFVGNAERLYGFAPVDM